MAAIVAVRTYDSKEDFALVSDAETALAARDRMGHDGARPQPDSETLRDYIVSVLEGEKAENIVGIDLRGRSAIGDYMVIASGRSSRQVSAIADKLTERLKQDYGRLSRVEGRDAGDWVLIDTGDVIVHVFRPEVREFYQLEKMWLPAESAGTES